MVWSQLELEKPHIAYACIGIFSTIFSLVSLFVKERLYIGEATVATLAGLILGPHCLGWLDPVSWGNSDYMTLEICRIVLCIQIVAIAVELPRKYMKKHWLSVAIFLLPVMTCGWLVVGLFIWALIPHFNFSSALLVSACVTATDPVLAAAVVGKGKFAERVPGHLRNILSAESGCNDGMAFPFIFLSLNLIIHPGNAGEIVKDWFLLTILWECFFGVALGIMIGLSMKYAVAFAEKKNLIDRESFLAIFVFLAFNSAGIGSMLGVDDLLVSFAAGTSFGWNGDFAKKTEESHVSTVIDLLLNLSFFVYFGSIVPWPQFNNADIGLNVWRLIVLAFVIIFLRRLPAVIALKPITPDVKTWREALFCGHFGPIGVGAIFAAILARKDLEGHYTIEETPLAHLPNDEFPHYQLLACIWPIVCFIVITSIVVHGSSVAVLTLGKRLNRMAITMSFTTTNTQEQGPSWMSRLQRLDKASTSFSLHRIDTQAPNKEKDDGLPQANTVETSGIKVRPAGGAKRRKHKKKKAPRSRLKKTLSRATTNDNDEEEGPSERHRPQAEFLQLGRTPSTAVKNASDEETEPESSVTDSPKNELGDSPISSDSIELNVDKEQDKIVLSIPANGTNNTMVEDDKQNVDMNDGSIKFEEDAREKYKSVPTTAFQEGRKIIIEDQEGEIVETLPIKNLQNVPDDNMSIHSVNSLRRHLSQYSGATERSSADSYLTDNSESKTPGSPLRRLSRTSTLNFAKNKRKAYYKKNDPNRRKVYAHQVDDFIVIENADGDIIRRYKVNRHPSRARSNTNSSMVGKALNFVGLKKAPKQETQVHDLEKNNRNEVLIPTLDDTENPNHPLKDPKFENAIETKLTKLLLNDKKEGSHTLSGANTDALAIPESEEESSSGTEETDEDDEMMHETEIERKRRLAALGEMPTARRDEDEED